MLTGKDIHAAFAQVDTRAKSWDNLTIMQQAAYDNVAAKLNERFFTPMQRRIADLEVQVNDLMETMMYGNERTPVDEHEALQEYAIQQLHREDVQP
jgi:hypothetical protein